MVQRRYGGLSEPKRHFEKLRPYREMLIRMAGEYAPTSWQYAELHKPVLALDAAAEAVCKRPRFYATPHHTAGAIQPPVDRWGPKSED